MEIRGIEKLSGQIAVGGAQKPAITPAAGGGSEGGDSVQISPVARYLEQYNNQPQIRNDKVTAARQAIQSGTMDTNGKLSIAIDRLLDDLLSN